MRISSYAFGAVTVDGRTFTSDVIVFPDGVKDSWWRRDGHLLCMEDLESVWPAAPETLVVGTGAFGRMTVPGATRAAIEAMGIAFHTHPTKDAAALFNRLEEEGERIAAALHLTC